MTMAHLGIPGVLRGGNWNGNLQLHQNLPSRSLSFCSVETHWFNCKPFPGCVWCGTPDPTGISGLEIGDRGYLYVATCGLDEISRFSADYALAATKRRHHRGRLSSYSWCGRKRVQFKALLTIIIHSILFSVHSTPSTKRSFPPSIPPPLAN